MHACGTTILGPELFSADLVTAGDRALRAGWRPRFDGRRGDQRRMEPSVPERAGTTLATARSIPDSTATHSANPPEDTRCHCPILCPDSIKAQPGQYGGKWDYAYLMLVSDAMVTDCRAAKQLDMTAIASNYVNCMFRRASRTSSSLRASSRDRYPRRLHLHADRSRRPRQRRRALKALQGRPANPPALVCSTRLEACASGLYSLSDCAHKVGTTNARQ